jgi:general secretion pathway protein J
MQMQTPTRQRGFTLIEIIIAVTIFSIMAVMAYSGLSSSLTVSAHTQEQSERLGRLQMGLLLIQRDFQQYYAQKIRNSFGDEVNPLLAGTALADRDDEGLLVEFSRMGWRNPADQSRGVSQRVAYVFDKQEGKLYRLYWAHMFQAPDAKPASTLLLDGLEEVRLEIRDKFRVWHTDWPPLNQSGGNPAMLLAKIILVFEGDGEPENRTLERWIEMPTFE